MFKTNLRRTAASLALLLAAGCAGARGSDPAGGGSTPGVTTVFVVRHAERASATDRDSPLSEAGRERARDLAEVLADAGVDAVYTSQYIRTRDTAAPLAERLGLPITVHPVENAEASSRELATRVLAEHAGGTVLIVGHSNTVPLIVEALGGTDVGPLEDSVYERLFIVVVRAPGEAGTTRARFGRPD
jgi:broad specificity phosphatase PhoE